MIRRIHPYFWVPLRWVGGGGCAGGGRLIGSDGGGGADGDDACISGAKKGGGEAGGGMRAEDSDGAVRRVTTSKELRAEAVMLDMRQISKKARQKV